MNEFSIVCRILGSLYYRQPEDQLLQPLLLMIKEGKLQDSWPLEQDALLQRLSASLSGELVQQDYNNLFSGTDCQVSPYRSAWVADDKEGEIRAFLVQRGMPLPEIACDHFGLLLLSASWIEDHAQQDEISGQLSLFEKYILPWSDTFLGKVEACSTTAFYRTLAVVTREAIHALYEELQESKE